MGLKLGFQLKFLISCLRVKVLIVVDDPDDQDAIHVTDADQEAVVHHPVAGQEGGVPLDRLVQSSCPPFD